VFKTRSYGERVHLVLWAGAKEKQLDKAIKRSISR
jgi:hypothetical protein